MRALLLVAAALGIAPGPIGGPSAAKVADRIVRALAPDSGEVAILRADPRVMPELASAVRGALGRRGVRVDVVGYGSMPDFERRLAKATIYVWLPTVPGRIPPVEQTEAIARWLDGGRGRALHYHGAAITTAADGGLVAAPARFEQMCAEAVELDYDALARAIGRASTLLRRGEVHVTTPGGTDLRMSLGTREIARQQGAATRLAVAGARVRAAREIELPAGALRVAPVEATVAGTIVIPRVRLDDRRSVGNVRLTVDQGIVVAVAAAHESVVRRELLSTPSLRHFRELGIGFNPKLVGAPGEDAIPYAGFGAGVVRLGLGDNTELGGAVRGGDATWLFFTDATVTVGADTLVKDGRLVEPPRRAPVTRHASAR
jgi:aminopeptidase